MAGATHGDSVHRLHPSNGRSLVPRALDHAAVRGRRFHAVAQGRVARMKTGGECGNAEDRGVGGAYAEVRIRGARALDQWLRAP
jgi:hypothetical protein